MKIQIINGCAGTDPGKPTAGTDPGQRYLTSLNALLPEFQCTAQIIKPGLFYI